MQTDLGDPWDPKYVNISRDIIIIKKSYRKTLISVITSVILNAHL